MFNTFPSGSLADARLRQARFVSGSGNWEIPSNLVSDFVVLTLVGGGGGGGFVSTAGKGGGGGGGGEVIYRFPFFVNPLVNSSIAYSVGSAGVGGDGAGANTDGTNGGASTFDFLSCAGGGLGAGTGSNGGAGGGASGGAGGTSGVDGGDGTLDSGGGVMFRWGGGGGGEGSYNVEVPSNAGDSPVFQGGGGQWQAADPAGPGGGSFTRGGYQPGAGTLVVPEFGAGGAGGLGTGNVSGQDGGSGLIIIEYFAG